MDQDEIRVVARAMEAKRRELMYHSLESIWPDLAKAALSATAEYRERVAQDGEALMRDCRNSPQQD
jgi:hypothetical protein